VTDGHFAEPGWMAM